MTREQLDISIQSNMPTNGVGFITAEHTRQVANDIADYVDSEIEDVEVDVTGLDGRMTEAETDINNLEGRVETAEGDIDSLEDRVGINEQDISQLKPVVAQHTTDINNLDGRMDTAEGDIDALETRVDGIGGDVTGLDSRVDTLEDKVDVLEPKVDQNTEDIDNIKTRVTQNERDINSLDDRMDTAEDNINNVEDDVNMAQRDITNLQGRMQRAEGDIQNIEANHYTKTESDGKYEQLMNKATDFTVINDVRYPTTKAVADYVSTVAANEIYYTTESDTYANVKAAVAANKFVILKYVNALVPLARVYNAGQANEYYVFVGHFTNESAIQIILNNTGWQQATTLALTNTIEGYETAENLFPSAKAVADYAYKKQTNGIPKTDLAEDVQESLDKADTAIQEEDLVEYAKVDGYYEGMGVGTADNLTGQTERTDDAMYRKSGGSEEVASGTATISNIKGQTIAWNRYGFSNVAKQADNTEGPGYNYLRVAVYGSNIQGNHIIFEKIIFSKCNITQTGSNNVWLYQNVKTLGIRGSSGENASTTYLTNGTKSVASIGTATNVTSNSELFFRIPVGTTIDIEIAEDLCIDLTLIYGAGNEPTTPEQFEADYFKWFGKPLTYEDYDAGSLKSVQLDSLKTTGFNQWDEQWEYGYINLNTGVYTPYSGGTPAQNNHRLVSKNLIPVFPDTSYYIYFGMIAAPGDAIYVVEYDANGDFVFGSVAQQQNKIYVTKSATRYIRFENYNFSITYSNDVCINISDPSRNGEYEPYEEHSVSLPVTTITGKLNGEGESVVVFPDGMKSAGSVYDEIYTVGDKTYAVKRVGSVALGTLSGFTATTNLFSLIFPEIPTATSSTEVLNGVVNKKYQIGFQRDWSNVDYQISRNNNAGTALLIRDKDYNDIASLKAFLTNSSVTLYYALENPQVYELDTFDLPKPYQVDNNGTEEQIQKSGVQGLAAILTILYGIDAVKILDKLPQNYISEKSMDNFLAQLNTVTGGTWTKTWNENTGEWDFSFTANAQTNDTNTDETI